MSELYSTKLFAWIGRNKATKHKTVKGLVYLFTNILTFLIYYRIIILKSQQNIINVKVNLKYESKVFNERF